MQSQSIAEMGEEDNYVASWDVPATVQTDEKYEGISTVPALTHITWTYEPF